tara:strand:- start:113 stop:463 length:351 start_codon:yes stop_codon:yes gene_type:complete
MPLFYSASHETLDKTQFERLGHPGRYTAVSVVKGTDQWFTGSMYGYGALLIGSGSAATFGKDDHVVLSGGGSIELKDLAKGPDDTESGLSHLIDVSVAYVSSSEDAPNVYVFKRQQ